VFLVKVVNVLNELIVSLLIGPKENIKSQVKTIICLKVIFFGEIDEICVVFYPFTILCYSIIRSG